MCVVLADAEGPLSFSVHAGGAAAGSPDSHRDGGLAGLGGRQLREQLVEVAHVEAAVCRCQVLLSLQTMEQPPGCDDVACGVATTSHVSTVMQGRKVQHLRRPVDWLRRHVQRHGRPRVLQGLLGCAMLRLRQHRDERQVRVPCNQDQRFLPCFLDCCSEGTKPSKGCPPLTAGRCTPGAAAGSDKVCIAVVPAGPADRPSWHASNCPARAHWAEQTGGCICNNRWLCSLCVA
jgi:hypothetical protein